MCVTVLAGRNALRVVKCNPGMRHGPRVAPPCAHQTPYRKRRVATAIAARGNGHGGSEARRGTGAFIRIAARTDDKAGQRVHLWQNKAAEVLACLFMPDTPIGILQAEHPLQVPAHLGKKVRDRAT